MEGKKEGESRKEIDREMGRCWEGEKILTKGVRTYMDVCQNLSGARRHTTTGWNF